MIHRPMQILFVFVIGFWLGYASPLFGQANSGPAVSAARPDPDQQKSTLERLNQMSPEELVELRKKKRQFDELSSAQQKQVRDFHTKLQSHANQNELSAVMKRYYAWLRNLDREERNSLLDLPPNERLEQIKKLHEERARKLFGTTGATKLPAQDVGPFIEWIKETREKKQSEISIHFNEGDGKQKIVQWRNQRTRTGRRFSRAWTPT